jgi:hypothetical protein|tara:strand:- start:14 stop:2881 length:2868 start_codon:yes stop_codon:yes gene_type:complete
MATTKIATPELFEFESTTSGVRLPSGTTAQRPSTNLNAGDFRYNTDDNKVEFYDGSNWFQIDDEGSSPIPSENFNTVLWAGTDASHAITGVGFQPDLVWIKRRSSPAESHALYDSIRGVNKQLESNSTTAEATNTAPFEGFTSFDTDGFTVDNNGATNRAPYTYVAWCWKAGGTAVSNTQGDIGSDVSANQNAGFSIVKYTGNSSYGQTVGHGLGVAPKLIIIKNLSNARNWRTYADPLGATNYINLDETSAAGTYGSFNNTPPTINVFSTTSSGAADRATNYPNDNYVAYCFADVAGYQKIGAYVGNGSTAGPILTTGFEPAFVMIKNTTGGDSWDDWYMSTNKTLTSGYLFANDSVAEQPYQAIRMLTNGFEVITNDTGVNENGNTYLYYAIASDPTSTTPSLTNSFKTNLYTGTGATQTLGGYLNGSAQFNGSSSVVEISSSAIDPANVFSVSMWFNTSSASTYTGLFTNNTNPMRVGEICIMKPNASAIQIFSANQAGVNLLDALTATSPEPFKDNTWYHVVVIADRSISNQRAKVFINGKECAYTAYGAGQASVTMYSNTRIGSADGQFFGGNIDQVRIFNGTLTDSQVLELYNETTTTANTLNFPTGAGCVAAYPLDSNSNDLSTNYNGTDTSIIYPGETSTNISLVWIKSRSNATSHELHDSVRGEPSRISSDTTAAASTSLNGFVSLLNNGFTLDGAGGGGEVNTSGRTYVAWNWGSSSIGSINNNGTSQSIVQPHTNAGFSIVKYKGTGSSATIGHGLSAAPELIFTKTLDSIDNWMVLSTAVGATKKASLNAPNDFDVDSAPWDDTAPTATVFTVGTKDATNKNGDELIAYCWHSISGYSKIGIYTGNNTTSNTIYTTDDGTSGGANGFEPGWLLIKRVDASANWRILDNTRSTSNPRDKELYPNLINQEGTFSAANFNSNSFEIITTDTSYNALNGEYLYLVIK